LQAFTKLNGSIEDAVKTHCAPLWMWFKSRPLNSDWDLLPLASLGFIPQDIDSVRSIMIFLQQNDADDFHKARMQCVAFLKCLESHTRKTQVNFLKSRIKTVDFTAVAG
jgi:hypothetical protein